MPQIFLRYLPAVKSTTFGLSLLFQFRVFVLSYWNDSLDRSFLRSSIAVILGNSTAIPALLYSSKFANHLLLICACDLMPFVSSFLILLLFLPHLQNLVCKSSTDCFSTTKIWRGFYRTVYHSNQNGPVFYTHASYMPRRLLIYNHRVVL